MESQFSLDKTLVLFRFYQKFMTVRTQHTTKPVIGEEKNPGHVRGISQIT